jgi:hypothetical protein
MKKRDWILGLLVYDSAGPKIPRLTQDNETVISKPSVCQALASKHFFLQASRSPVAQFLTLIRLKASTLKG